MAGSGNAFQQSANGMRLAGQSTLQNMNYQPMQVQSPGGYSPLMVNTNQPGMMVNMQNMGYAPQQVSAPTYNAAQLANTDLSPYLNPFMTNVVDNAIGDLDRARLMELNQSGAQASSAGAFGGARQALLEAENNRNFYDRAGNMASQLRLQGYQNAQNAALADVGAQNQAGQFNASQTMQANLANQNAAARAAEFQRQMQLQGEIQNQGVLMQGQLANQSADAAARALASQQAMQAQMANQSSGLQSNAQNLAAAQQMSQLANLGFGMGNTLNNNMAQQGAMQQMIMQQLANASRNQFMQYQGAPWQSLGGFGQALGSLPIPQSSTSSMQPGFFDYATLGASLFMSDVRLKADVQPEGERNGHRWYSWRWNRKARHMGAPRGRFAGVLAQEIQRTRPDAVVRGDDGYLRVNYGAL